LTWLREAYARVMEMRMELDEIVKTTKSLIAELELALKILNEYEEKLKQVKQ